MQIPAEVEIKPAQAKTQNLQLRIMQQLQVAAWKGRGVRLWEGSWTCYFYRKGEGLGRMLLKQKLFPDRGGYWSGFCFPV